MMDIRMNDVPLLTIALQPLTDADRRQLSHGLAALMAEDSTLGVSADDQTGEVVIGGVGELHLEIVIDRLRREFNVEASVGRPQVAFKEMPTSSGQGEAEKNSRPVILEPVMQLEVVVPEECLAGVVASLASRRGRIESHAQRAGMHVIAAYVPLAELFGYSGELRERTRGRGTFTMRFGYYQRRPPGDDGDGDRDSFVGVPRNGPSAPRNSRIGVPEPADGALDD